MSCNPFYSSGRATLFSVQQRGNFTVERGAFILPDTRFCHFNHLITSPTLSEERGASINNRFSLSLRHRSTFVLHYNKLRKHCTAIVTAYFRRIRLKQRVRLLCVLSSVQVCSSHAAIRPWSLHPYESVARTDYELVAAEVRLSVLL